MGHPIKMYTWYKRTWTHNLRHLLIPNLMMKDMDMHMCKLDVEDQGPSSQEMIMRKMNNLVLILNHTIIENMLGPTVNMIAHMTPNGKLRLTTSSLEMNLLGPCPKEVNLAVSSTMITRQVNSLVLLWNLLTLENTLGLMNKTDTQIQMNGVTKPATSWMDQISHHQLGLELNKFKDQLAELLYTDCP